MDRGLALLLSNSATGTGTATMSHPSASTRVIRSSSGATDQLGEAVERCQRKSTTLSQLQAVVKLATWYNI